METTKRLYRSRKHKIIGGVCGGIADYFNWDPVLVRLLFFVIFLITTGYGLLAYILGWIIIPREELEVIKEETKEEEVIEETTEEEETKEEL